MSPHFYKGENMKYQDEARAAIEMLISDANKFADGAGNSISTNLLDIEQIIANAEKDVNEKNNKIEQLEKEKELLRNANNKLLTQYDLNVEKEKNDPNDPNFDFENLDFSKMVPKNR